VTIADSPTRPRPAVEEARAYIGGTWRDGERREAIRSPIDGSTGTVVCTSSRSEIAEATAAASDAWRSWRQVPAHERSRLLDTLADLVKARREDLTVQVVSETGKLWRESAAEVAQASDILHVCAEEAKRIAGDGVPMDALAAGTDRLGFTLRVPLGVIAGITPFNVPISAPCHKLGPALAAGNTFVLKPAPHGAGVASLLAELTAEAGIPTGVFNLVQGGADVGEALVTRPEVRLITLTGSGRAAEGILAKAGLKQTLFELGGIAPTIVHSDADVGAAVDQTVAAIFALTGQSCVSTQRILVHERVLREFTAALIDATRNLRPGDPFDEQSGIGPLVSEEAAIRVESWVQEAVASGAQLLCGGKRDGAYLEPTVLNQPDVGSRVLCEEIFGPVASITHYSRLEDAFAIANGTLWGLKAGIFTSSLAVALLAARELDFGSVNINGPSRFRLIHEPYGGVKLSGWGREGPRYAVRAMTAERLVTFAPVVWPEG
jgi:acyl-CoA reductase-like NAD-dependent aldehyde dehydrogenase